MKMFYVWVQIFFYIVNHVLSNKFQKLSWAVVVVIIW